MSEKVTLELPDNLAQRIRAVAAQARRPFEDVLIESIDRALEEVPVDWLPDDQLLVLCDAQLPDGQQEELSDLLARNREETLPAAERERLHELMQVYRRGLVRKANALRTAVARGLRPRLE